jgi:class 3 adenylate cyclase/tetratricopeptide (TPR) repeat protein
MRCRKCHFENPEGMRFCGACGTELEVTCPECSFSNPPGFKFCGDCGHDLRTPPGASPLQELSFDEKLAKIQKYLPSGLSEKILSQRDKIEGEKRQVTIMFVDMKGFTPLTEKLGPEETFSLMDQVFEILIHKVHEYEGTVNELRGDGILALFGAPIALEDGPQRAIRSSLAMHRAMVRFSEKVRAERGIPPILVRIGINTGPVVVGTLGNDLRVQFTAVGDTINMAARMEQIAEPGTTYVTGETFKLTEGYFRFEALGEREVKGKATPMRVYRVIAPSTRRTRFDVSAERGLTPFVGRERELELLLDGLHRAKTGRGQAFSIVAEAGLGKSRLLYEFRKAMANQDVTFWEGRCLSYGTGVAYHPITDMLRAHFSIEERDDDSLIAEKVKRGLIVLGADESATLPYLLEILSVEESGMDRLQMSPEGTKDRIVQALKTIPLKSSEIRPLIMAIEDLHWMDKSSEHVVKNLLESIPGARILLIFTYRPEFVHTWGGKSFHSQLTLNRLSNRESLAMVAHLLGTEDIAGDVEDLILEKTEGIPFFVEEFVRSLKDLKIIERTGAKFGLAEDRQRAPIPSTIQDVIMARVDGLPEGPKETLQTASVIEREFSHELIKAVTTLPEQELLSRLSILKDSELIYERGIYPESAYVFKHALTREVVYDSLLTERKKRLHEMIGNAVEVLFRANIDDHYAELAQHYLEAENWEKAAEYSRVAGKRAAKTASINDAIAHGKKTVASLERMPRTDDVRKSIIDARTFLGLQYHQISQINKAKQAVDPIVDPPVKYDYGRRLSQIYTIMGAAKYWVEEDFSGAFAYLNDALKIARELGDVLSLSFGTFDMATAMMLDCQYDDSFVHYQEMLKINKAAGSLWGTAIAKSFQGQCNSWHGKIDAGYRTSHEAVLLAERSGDIVSRSFAHVTHGISCYGKGSFQEAERHLVQGTALCESADVPVYLVLAQWYLGEICVDTGGYETSGSHYSEAERVLDQFEALPSLRNLLRTAWARAKVLNNSRSIELETLYTYVDQNSVKVFEGWIRRYLGDIMVNIDDRHTSEAQHWIEEAIEADERNSMRFNLGRDYALYAELFKRKGETVKAKDQLGKALEIYKECGADGWVTKAEEELERLS